MRWIFGLIAGLALTGCATAPGYRYVDAGGAGYYAGTPGTARMADVRFYGTWGYGPWGMSPYWAGGWGYPAFGYGYGWWPYPTIIRVERPWRDRDGLHREAVRQAHLQPAPPPLMSPRDAMRPFPPLRAPVTVPRGEPPRGRPAPIHAAPRPMRPAPPPMRLMPRPARPRDLQAPRRRR